MCALKPTQHNLAVMRFRGGVSVSFLVVSLVLKSLKCIETQRYSKGTEEKIFLGGFKSVLITLAA